MSGTASIRECPDCARVLRFASLQTTLIICPSCGTVISRLADKSLKPQPNFTIAYKNDIIQPGTTGKWKDRPFTVLGRFRAWFEESVFNYWTVQFSDEQISWLAEGYGIYYFLQPIEIEGNFSSRKISDTSTRSLLPLLPKTEFIVDKKQVAIKWEIEGELSIPYNASPTFRLLECSAQNGKDIHLFDWGNDKVEAYEAVFTSFTQLELSNLREYQPSERNFLCSNCSNRIVVKTFPYAQSCGCPKCGQFYALQNGAEFKKEKSKVSSETIYLPLGAKGIINNIDFEVIGYAQKQEDNVYRSKWREYTLYNPGEGFYFLSEYDGHWTLLKENPDSPVLFNQNDRSFNLDGEPFQLYNAYTSTVIHARGEFPYNIFDNEDTKAREFISPPEIWIQERNPKEGITWYAGAHIDHKTVAKAFNATAMPRKKGTGAVEPAGYLSVYKLVAAAIAGVLFLAAIHWAINSTKQERVLMDRVFMIPDSANQVSVVTEKYVLDKWSSNLRFYIYAPVSNSWFELSATAVNAQTGKEYSMQQGVEYYYGYSGGESWSEGSTTENGYIKKIPAGTYFIQLQGLSESGANKIKEFRVEITYDVPSTRNLIWALVLVLLWPIGKYIFIYYREQNRWSNSPYST